MSSTLDTRIRHGTWLVCFGLILRTRRRRFLLIEMCFMMSFDTKKTVFGSFFLFYFVFVDVSPFFMLDKKHDQMRSRILPQSNVN